MSTLETSQRGPAGQSSATRRATICIVSSGPASWNPRAVKEADALCEAGYRVLVRSAQPSSWVVPWDCELAGSKPWSYRAVRYDAAELRPRWNWFWTGIRQKAFGKLASLGLRRAPVPELAFARAYAEQLAQARKERAALYIAHNLAALPVAVRVAEEQGVPVAFDAEDDHLGEFHFGAEDCLEAELVRTLESRYLPRCTYVSCASAGIADALERRYGIDRPTPIHNVFPWSDHQTLDGKVIDRRGEALSLYWYSQTVGLDRGLQDVLRAAGRVKGNVQIHIRGQLEPDVADELGRVAHECGVDEVLFFHPQVHPSQLLSRTAEHDIGLALEQPVSPNRLATVTNKAFFYMLAGLAVVATDTPGQRTVLETSPEAGFLYTPGDVESLASHLQRLQDEPDRLAATKSGALAAAKDRWNWERESKALLQLVESALGNEPRRHEVVGTK